MTNTGESAHEIDAAHTETAEKFVVCRYVDIETILAGWCTARRTTAVLEFIAIQGIYQNFID